MATQCQRRFEQNCCKLSKTYESIEIPQTEKKFRIVIELIAFKFEVRFKRIALFN